MEQEETQIYQNQVTALEEAKVLLTTEVVSLRQKLALLEKDHVPNGKVLDRANELAAENVGLKAAVDDMTSENEDLRERLKVLENKIASRDSKDDSEVLKQELINVQKAMDDSLQEKEKEYNKLKLNYEEMFYEKQQYIDNITQREKDIIELKSRLKGTSQDRDDRQQSTDEVELNLKSKIENLSAENERNKASLCEKDTMIRARDEKILSLSRTLEQKITLLEDKLHSEKDLKSSLEEAKTLSKSKGSDLDKLQKSLEASLKEEKRCSSKIEELEESLRDMTVKYDLERSEKEKLKVECSSKESLVCKLESSLEDRNSKMVQLETQERERDEEKERFNKEREDLLAKIEAGEGVNEAVKQLNSENSHLQDKYQEVVRESKEKEMEFSLKVETLRENLQRAKNEANTKQEDCRSLQGKLSESIKMLQKTEQSNQELLEKQSELENDLDALKDELKNNSELNEETVKLLQYDLNERERVNEKLKAKCDKSSEDNLLKEDLIKELENKFTATISEKESLSLAKASLEDSLQKEKRSVEKLKDSLNSANDKEIEMEIQIKDLQEKKSQGDENVKLLKQAKTILQEEKFSLERSIGEKEKEEASLLIDLENKKGRISLLEAGIAQTEEKVNEMRATIEAALGKERNLLSDLEEKKKTIFAIEEEKANIVISFESQQTILDRLRVEKDTAEKERKMVKAELQCQEEKVCQLQQELEKVKTSVADEMGELRTARDLLLTEIVGLRNDKESVTARLVLETEQSQARVAGLEIKLQDSKLTVEKLRQELEREKTLSAENSAQARQTEERLEASLSQSSGKLLSLSGDLARLRDSVTAAELARDEAESKVLEQEAGLASALEEKRGLLERLMASEAETERTRNMTVELRRKLDDAQAALHELGRENQSIQVCRLVS